MPVTINAVSGYSGGGRQMIEARQGECIVAALNPVRASERPRRPFHPMRRASPLPLPISPLNWPMIAACAGLLSGVRLICGGCDDEHAAERKQGLAVIAARI